MLDLRPGGLVPIPCRNCGKLISFRIALGVTVLPCPACGLHTRVISSKETYGTSVRTELLSIEAPSKR